MSYKICLSQVNNLESNERPNYAFDRSVYVDISVYRLTSDYTACLLERRRKKKYASYAQLSIFSNKRHILTTCHFIQLEEEKNMFFCERVCVYIDISIRASMECSTRRNNFIWYRRARIDINLKTTLDGTWHVPIRAATQRVHTVCRLKRFSNFIIIILASSRYTNTVPVTLHLVDGKEEAFSFFELTPCVRCVCVVCHLSYMSIEHQDHEWNWIDFCLHVERIVLVWCVYFATTKISHLRHFIISAASNDNNFFWQHFFHKHRRRHTKNACQYGIVWSHDERRCHRRRHRKHPRPPRTIFIIKKYKFLFVQYIWDGINEQTNNQLIYRRQYLCLSLDVDPKLFFPSSFFMRSIAHLGFASYTLRALRWICHSFDGKQCVQSVKIGWERARVSITRRLWFFLFCFCSLRSHKLFSDMNVCVCVRWNRWVWLHCVDASDDWSEKNVRSVLTRNMCNLFKPMCAAVKTQSRHRNILFCLKPLTSTLNSTRSSIGPAIIIMVRIGYCLFDDILCVKVVLIQSWWSSFSFLCLFSPSPVYTIISSWRITNIPNTY